MSKPRVLRELDDHGVVLLTIREVYVPAHARGGDPDARYVGPRQVQDDVAVFQLDVRGVAREIHRVHEGRVLAFPAIVFVRRAKEIFPVLDYDRVKPQAA